MNNWTPINTNKFLEDFAERKRKMFEFASPKTNMAEELAKTISVNKHMTEAMGTKGFAQKMTENFAQTMQEMSRSPIETLRQVIAEQEQRQKELRESLSSLLSMKMAEIANYSSMSDMSLDFPQEEVKINWSKKSWGGISKWAYDTFAKTYDLIKSTPLLSLLIIAYNMFNYFQDLKRVVNHLLQMLP